MAIPSRSRIAWVLALVMLAPTSILAADDIRVGKLEQDVLELQRLIRQQERRIESLERELATAPRSGAPAPAPAAGRATNSAQSGLWTNTANWEKLQPGMPELEVVQVLGPPTSLRDATDGSKTLYYAMEIGTGSFLMGSIVIADRRILEIHKPTFK